MASFFRGLSTALLLGGSSLLTALTFGLTGCGDDPAPSGTVCGGITNADGKCIAKCVEKRDCTGNQICSTIRAPEGTCEAPCGADKECAVGSSCVEGVNMAGGAVKICQTREQLSLPANGFGVACKQPADCDVAHGLTCDGGKCGLPLGEVCKAGTECLSGACDNGKCRPRFLEDASPCESNGECKSGVCDDKKCAVVCLNLNGCPAGTECQGLETGKGVCRAAPGLASGQYSQACPKGDECDEAAGFVCIGLVGDVDAFCSKPGACATDDECPAGYWCGGVRDTEGEEGKIPGSQRTCVKRSFCAPCEADADCGFTFGARCVPDANGTKFCTTTCTPDKRSCRFGAECVDTGGGEFHCRPDSGSCAAPTPGEAKSCDACRNDLDCGPGGYCLGSVVQGAINKPSVRWCVTPCGPADADGKRTCPKATNGLEMVCLDENNLDLATRELGVSTGEGKDATIPVLPGYCYPAPTFDNEVSYDNDPPKNVCGNGQRDPGEECDDANKSTTDGCVDCKITEKCRFSITTDNSDADPSLTASDGSVVASIPTSCKSFLVEGALETGGDIDVVDYEMGTNLTTSLVEVFTGELGTCNADLVLEVRDGQKPDVTSSCAALFPPTLRFNSLLQCKNNIGCGSCDEGSNLCGLCDDDSGIGNCPRVLIERVTSFNGDKVVNASPHKWMRLRARDTALTVPSYKVIVTGLKADTSNPGSLVNRPELHVLVSGRGAVAARLGLLALLASACNSEIPAEDAPAEPTLAPCDGSADACAQAAEEQLVADPDPFARSSYGAAQLPIVLAHGFNASTTNSWAFFKVKEALEADGNFVVLAEVPPFNGVPKRAAALVRQIDDARDAFCAARPSEDCLETVKVNLIAHSMGGLDARYAISALGYAPRVASLTTISTPHGGSAVADVALKILPDDGLGRAALDGLARLWGRTITDDELANDADLRAAFESLAEQNAPAFAVTAPNDMGVYYQSWAGVSRVTGGLRLSGAQEDVRAACDGKVFGNVKRADFMDLSLAPMSAVVGRFSTVPQDGMVTVANAKWGEFQGCIAADHLDQVGQPKHEGRNKWTSFDHRSFYRSIATDLGRRGF